jgi:hypothetical protein
MQIQTGLKYQKQSLDFTKTQRLRFDFSANINDIW